MLFDVCMFFQVFVFAAVLYLNATAFHVYRAKVGILRKNMEPIFKKSCCFHIDLKCSFFIFFFLDSKIIIFFFGVPVESVIYKHTTVDA